MKAATEHDLRCELQVVCVWLCVVKNLDVSVALVITGSINCQECLGLCRNLSQLARRDIHCPSALVVKPLFLGTLLKRPQ